MQVSALTGTGNYFEDFKVGEVLKHARGKTVEPLEQVWITNVTMNTAENALAELGMDKIRLKGPLYHGDTLYCFSEVMEARDSDREDAGIVRFKHYGVNQRDQHIFEGERWVLVKRRSHWGDK